MQGRIYRATGAEEDCWCLSKLLNPIPDDVEGYGLFESIVSSGNVIHKLCFDIQALVFYTH